jgi:hypothetical protein
MRALPLTLSFISLMGCVGEADWALAPNDAMNPAGPMGPEVPMVAFTGLSEGLPASPSLAGTAQLDGTLYAIANDGLYSLATGANKWDAVAVMKSGERAMSVTRIDNSIYMTTSGGLYRQSLNDMAFSAVAAAPAVECYGLIKKDGELLMTTAGALMVSADSGATWTVRSSAALFAGATTLVASPAALRIFVVQNGTLFHSDDNGATWTDGLVQGHVSAIQAAGAYVLVQTDTQALRSDNYGNTFHPMDVGGTAGAFAISGQRAYAGTDKGLRVSIDGGATWMDAGNGLPAGAAVTQLYLSGAALVAGTGSGVYIAQVQ